MKRFKSKQEFKIGPKKLLPKAEIHHAEERAVFQAIGGIDRSKYIVVHYVLIPKSGLSLAQAAARVAIVTSNSCLSLLPYESLESRIEHDGLVLSAQPNGQVIIGYPTNLCTRDEGLTQLIALCISAAEYDFCDQFWVEQLELPSGFLVSFNGPQFGVQGIREILQIPNRPLIGATITTRYGVPLSAIAEQSRKCLYGGTDYIADDVFLIDPTGEMAFSKRVPVLSRIAHEVSKETGEKKWYIANIGSSPMKAMEYAKMCEAEGVGAIRINGFLSGFATLEDLANRINLPLISSNMGVILLTRGGSQRSIPSLGISEAIVSILSRLAGADAVHLGSVNAGCRIQVSWDPAIVSLKSPYHNIKPSFALAAADITIANVWDNISNFGCDLMIEASDGIFGYPWGSYEGAQAFRRFVTNLPDTLSEKEARERIFEISQQDAKISQALDYYNYHPSSSS